MSVTMVEREKKLLRMNTVPIMENVASLQNLSSFNKLPTNFEENSNDGGTNAWNWAVAVNVYTISRNA